MPVSLETEQKLQVTAVCRLGENPLAGKRLKVRPYDLGLMARVLSLVVAGLQKTWFRSFGLRVNTRGKNRQSRVFS